MDDDLVVAEAVNDARNKHGKVFIKLNFEMAYGCAKCKLKLSDGIMDKRYLKLEETCGLLFIFWGKLDFAGVLESFLKTNLVILPGRKAQS